MKEKRGTDARDRIIEPRLIPFRGCCQVNRMKVHVEQASAKSPVLAFLSQAGRLADPTIAVDHRSGIPRPWLSLVRSASD